LSPVRVDEECLPATFCNGPCQMNCDRGCSRATSRSHHPDNQSASVTLSSLQPDRHLTHRVAKTGGIFHVRWLQISLMTFFSFPRSPSYFGDACYAVEVGGPLHVFHRP